MGPHAVASDRIPPAATGRPLTGRSRVIVGFAAPDVGHHLSHGVTAGRCVSTAHVAEREPD
jgi:hypothetical protein